MSPPSDDGRPSWGVSGVGLPVGSDVLIVGAAVGAAVGSLVGNRVGLFVLDRWEGITREGVGIGRRLVSSRREISLVPGGPPETKHELARNSRPGRRLVPLGRLPRRRRSRLDLHRRLLLGRDRRHRREEGREPRGRAEGRRVRRPEPSALLRVGPAVDGPGGTLTGGRRGEVGSGQGGDAGEYRALVSHRFVFAFAFLFLSPFHSLNFSTLGPRRFDFKVPPHARCVITIAHSRPFFDLL